MKTTPHKFADLAVSTTFSSPRNGWTYRKLANGRKGAGRAEFVAGCPPELVGKTCVYSQTSKALIQ